jgi:hypothetical protein
MILLLTATNNVVNLGVEEKCIYFPRLGRLRVLLLNTIALFKFCNVNLDSDGVRNLHSESVVTGELLDNSSPNIEKKLRRLLRYTEVFLGDSACQLLT